MHITRHFSYANVIASLALFIALGGISWAAVALPKNSVGTTQLKRNAVTGAKIRGNAVTAAKVRNGSLVAADFKAGQLPAGPRGLLAPRVYRVPRGTLAAGPVTGELPSGATLRGVFNVDFGQLGQRVRGRVDLVRAAPRERACRRHHRRGGALDGRMPGLGDGSPGYARNVLHVREQSNASANPLAVCDAKCSGDLNASRFGAELFVKSTNAARAFSTAPGR